MDKKNKIKMGMMFIFLLIIGGLCFIFIPNAKKSNDTFSTPDIKTCSEGKNGIIIDGKRYANKHGKELFSAVLIGKNEGRLVKLMWILHGWPDSMTGAVVKRKQKDNWQELVNGGNAIRPEIQLERNWAAMGMNTAQTNEYRSKLDVLGKTGKIKFVSSNEFSAFLREKGIRAGDRIAMTNNNDLAFFMGFGAIDNKPTKSDEYGVFAIDQHGKIADAPFATWKNEPLSHEKLFVSKISPFTQKQKVGFFWELPENINSKYGLIGFDVFKRKDDNWETLGRTYGNLSKKNQLEFRFVDNQTDAVGIHHYAISAVNYFNENYPKIELIFDEKEFGNIANPELISITTENENVHVKGKILKTDLSKVKSISLERCSNQDDNFKSFAEVKVSAAEFIVADKSNKELDCYYFYRFVVKLKNGRSVFSARKGVASPAKLPKLASPSNFKVERIKKRDNYELKFTWDKVADAKSYRFYQKSQHATELAQLLAVTGNSYTMPYPAQFDTQIWSFGIAAEPHDEQKHSSSDLTVIKDMKLMTANLNPVKNLAVQANLDSILLQWENTEPSVTQFEILLNGKNMLTLPATARDALLSQVNETQNGEGKNGVIEIALVSINELGRAAAKASLYFKIPDPRTKEIPKVNNFKAELKTNNGKKVIELSWDALSKEKNKIDGILLQYEIPMLNDRGILLEKTYKGAIPNKFIFEVPEKAMPGAKIKFKISILQILQVKSSFPALSGAWTALNFTII